MEVRSNNAYMPSEAGGHLIKTQIEEIKIEEYCRKLIKR